MKRIEAIIRQTQFNKVKVALEESGCTEIICTEVKFVSEHKGFTEMYRGTEYAVDLVPRVCVGVVVDDDLENNIIATIQKAAYTGKIGDGKITVMPVSRTIDIFRSGPEIVDKKTHSRINSGGETQQAR